MSLRIGYWIDCDGPGEYGDNACLADSGLQAGKREAREWVQKNGWKRRRAPGGGLIDLCPDCAKKPMKGA